MRASHRSLVTWCQRGSWVVGQGARLRYAIRLESGRLSRDAGRPLILASTHQSNVDPLLLGLALPYRRWRALTPLWVLVRTHSRGPLVWLMPLFRLVYHVWGGIELPPEERDEVSMHEKVLPLVDALARGDVVMIFPEGKIRAPRDPVPGEFARGVVHLHRASGAPVVPIAVRLGERAWPRRRYGVRIGEPVRIPQELDLDQGADWLRRRALDLLRALPDGPRP